MSHTTANTPENNPPYDAETDDKLPGECPECPGISCVKCERWRVKVNAQVRNEKFHILTGNAWQ